MKRTMYVTPISPETKELPLPLPGTEEVGGFATVIADGNDGVKSFWRCGIENRSAKEMEQHKHGETL